MLIGYARVSTDEQSLDLQLDALKGAGCKRIFTDKASTTKAIHPGLADAVSHLRDRDVLVIWKLDRLGRTVKGLVDFVADLRDALESQKNAGPLMLVGHSTGAAVSALYAALNPQRVSRLVMIEPIAPTLRAAHAPLARLAGDLRYMNAAPEHPVYPDIETAARMLTANHPKLDEGAALALARRITREVPAGVTWTWDARLRNQFGIDLSLTLDEYLAVLETLHVPLLRIYGRSSEFANTPALLSPDVPLPKSGVVFLDGSHNLHTDAASAVAERVAAHFDIPAEGQSHAP